MRSTDQRCSSKKGTWKIGKGVKVEIVDDVDQYVAKGLDQVNK